MRRFLAETLAVVFFLAQGVPSPASAAVLYWDADGKPPVLGGAGTWNTSKTNWFSQDSGSYVAWNNSANNDAVLGPTGGTVSISVPVTVHDITIGADAYTLTGQAVTLTGDSPTISVAASSLATISSQIGGSAGLAKTGSGTLVLSGSNSYSGATVVADGVLRLSGTNALPGGVKTVGGTSHLNLAGGVIKITASSSSPSSIFSRSLGTGPSEVEFTGSGGFQVYYSSTGSSS